ncbi:MAG: hypothetical protein M1812_004530 [Candelaria pacifica]|nr:MAG: hypothetical protein M1812_004530 [Candelaria pacifica]
MPTSLPTSICPGKHTNAALANVGRQLRSYQRRFADAVKPCDAETSNGSNTPSYEVDFDQDQDDDDDYSPDSGDERPGYSLNGGKYGHDRSPPSVRDDQNYNPSSSESEFDISPDSDEYEHSESLASADDQSSYSHSNDGDSSKSEKLISKLDVHDSVEPLPKVSDHSFFSSCLQTSTRVDLVYKAAELLSLRDDESSEPLQHQRQGHQDRQPKSAYDTNNAQSSSHGRQPKRAARYHQQVYDIQRRQFSQTLQSMQNPQISQNDHQEERQYLRQREYARDMQHIRNRARNSHQGEFATTEAASTVSKSRVRPKHLKDLRQDISDADWVMI